MLRQICSPTTKPATTNPDHLGAWLGPLLLSPLQDSEVTGEITWS
jgi:hypothetical protein